MENKFKIDYSQISGESVSAKGRGNNKDAEKNKLTTVEAFTPLRKFTGAEKKFEKGEYIPGLGLASLAMINLPSDFSDVVSSAKEVKAFFQGKIPEYSYDYSKAQHPFSFFRKTMLHKPLEWLRERNANLVDKILFADITVTKTAFGEKVLKFLNTKKVNNIPTKIHDISSCAKKEKFVKARVYDGGNFGKLTARAMERTTLIGLGLVALCELPTILKATKTGDNLFEKTDNTAKQIFKSGLNVGLVTAGSAYAGAIGAKHFKATGSWFGMCFGALLGGYVANKVQQQLN